MGSLRLLICFFTNSKDEKKIMLMRQERAMETPNPMPYSDSAKSWRTECCLTSIHSRIEELNFRHLHGFTPALCQAIALIMSFGRVDWIYLRRLLVRTPLAIQQRHTQAQETRPQSPPDMATGRGEVGDTEPWKVASNCLPLS